MPLSRTLYEPSTEHDSCGFGFVCDIAGRPSHQIVRDYPREAVTTDAGIWEAMGIRQARPRPDRTGSASA